MLSSLLDGTRAARAPLAYGLGLLLFAYLLDLQHRWLNESSVAGDRLLYLHANIGTGGRVAFWSFVAFTAGSIVDRGLQKVMDTVLQLPRPVNWERFILAAERDMKRVEVLHVVTDKLPDRSYGWRSSRDVSNTLREIERRERMHAEARFRIVLIVALIPAAVVLLVELSWWLVLAVVLVLVLDFIFQQDAARSEINGALRASAAEGLHSQLKLTAGLHAGWHDDIWANQVPADELTTVGLVSAAADRVLAALDDDRVASKVADGPSTLIGRNFDGPRFKELHAQLSELLKHSDQTFHSRNWRRRALAEEL